MREAGTEFGRELRRLRLEGDVKYSQTQLAKLAGIKASYISQLETGKRKPTPKVIRRLSPHLGVPANHLLSTIGLIEMDLARTLAANRDEISRKLPDLTPEQIEEAASFLTYLEFKASLKGFINRMKTSNAKQ